MKGFVHLIEIIIITLVMFFLIFQFSLIPRVNTDWSGAKLVLQGNDILFTLESKNIDWSNAAVVQSEISPFLAGKNIVYDLKIVNETGTYHIIQSSINSPTTIFFYSARNATVYKVYEVVLTLGYTFG